MVLVLPLVKLLTVIPVKASTYPDSRSYVRLGSWMDFSLTSLDGSSLRPWGVTAWLALWPGEPGIVIGHALLSAVAWGALALAVAGLVDNPVVRRGVAASLVLIACTAQIASWDSVILGESVSLSTGILALAALVWLVRDPGWSRAGLFAAAALWFAMTRPNVFPVLVGWALSLVLVGILRRRVVVWAVAAALVVFSGYSYAYNIGSDAAWTAAYGASRTTVSLAYPIGPWNPSSRQILADLRKSNAPRCMFGGVGQNGAVVGGGMTWVTRTVAKCPAMNTWATDNWQRWYLNWLVTHPAATMGIIVSQVPYSLAPTIWGTVAAATPNSVAQLYLGTPDLPQDAHPTQSYHVQPLILWLLGAVVLAIAGARRRLWRASPWPVDLALAGSLVGSMVSVLSSALLIQTAPFEVAQESLASACIITAAAVSAVAVGLDRVLTPRRDARAGRRAEAHPA
ncbi:MAG TPA: hypothetical protein VGN50_09075 [Pedococcus sp.]|nr:hypothetical protein [Pedococcus sp.]